MREIMVEKNTTIFKDLLVEENDGLSTLSVNCDMSPIVVVANRTIREQLDEQCLAQAMTARLAPGISHVVLNPDAHLGYGVPVGSVLASPTHIYPGPVGVDIKCSMSLLQTNLPSDALGDIKTRRAVIKSICQRIPTGAGRGSKSVPKSRHVDEWLGFELCTQGASKNVLRKLGIPHTWSHRCEDVSHRAWDGSLGTLEARLQRLLRDYKMSRFPAQMNQLGSYGGGNHFGECEVVQVSDKAGCQEIARHWGLKDGHIAFLSHCGSRGFGHTLASRQFKYLKSRFKKTGRGFPGGDSELVFAEHGSDEAVDYLSDMALAANFATVNHLLINQLVLEAFQQVVPGTVGELIYFISHNIVRHEQVDGRTQWVHRKGATRALPAGHPELMRTEFESTGHPILLPGNPRDGSAVMVALPGAQRSLFSVNHGAGRVMSRRKAKATLDQHSVDCELLDHDIISNCHKYPKDESPAVYKNFNEVLASVRQAGLAEVIARLQARFVIKDGAEPDD